MFSFWRSNFDKLALWEYCEMTGHVSTCYIQSDPEPPSCRPIALWWSSSGGIETTRYTSTICGVHIRPLNCISCYSSLVCWPRNVLPLQQCIGFFLVCKVLAHKRRARNRHGDLVFREAFFLCFSCRLGRWNESRLSCILFLIPCRTCCHSFFHGYVFRSACTSLWFLLGFRWTSRATSGDSSHTTLFMQPLVHVFLQHWERHRSHWQDLRVKRSHVPAGTWNGKRFQLINSHPTSSAVNYEGYIINLTSIVGHYCFFSQHNMLAVH